MGTRMGTRIQCIVCTRIQWVAGGLISKKSTTNIRVAVNFMETGGAGGWQRKNPQPFQVIS
jgi:hypothetical protein